MALCEEWPLDILQSSKFLIIKNFVMKGVSVQHCEFQKFLIIKDFVRVRSGQNVVVRNS